MKPFINSFYTIVLITLFQAYVYGQSTSILLERKNEVLKLLEEGKIKAQSKVIRVKLNPEYEKLLSVSNTSEQYAKTGVSALDIINKDHQVTKWERLFPPAGKFEEKHKRYGLHLWYKLVLENDENLYDLVQTFENTEYVQMAEPVYEKTRTYQKDEAKSAQLPNDPFFPNQWNFNNTGQSGGLAGSDIKLPDAWEIETGSPEVIVAVNDGGIDYDHEDLIQNIWINENEIPGNGIDDDLNGYIDDIYGYNFGDQTHEIFADEHGTHVAGIIAANNNNGKGIASVAGGTNGSGVKLMSCTIFGDMNIDGNAEAFIYSADNGAVISQNSWGYVYSGVYEMAVLEAIDYFIAEAGTDENGNQTGPMKGGLVVFSSGNDYSSANYYPAYYDKVIAVGATDNSDFVTNYSNYGSWVDLYAPGGDYLNGILSTLPNNQYGTMYGTSMASPHVSGTVALIISHYINDHFTPDQIRKILYASSDDLESYYSYKFTRINATKALTIADNNGIPEPISDFSATQIGPTSLKLQWASPYIKPDSSITWSYDLRFSTRIINTDNFNNAFKIQNTPDPSAPGSIENMIINDLKPGVKYYFAIKSANIYQEFSPISNIVSATIPDAAIANLSLDSIYVDLKPGEESTATVSITNKGKKDLRFSIREFENEASSSTTLSVDESTGDVLQHSKSLQITSLQKQSSTDVYVFRGNDGDSGFGYKWMDSRHPEGPEFSWTDISRTGRQLFIGEISSEQIILPFAFPFYGTKRSVIYVGNPGIISFESNRAWSWNVEKIPSSTVPNSLIAAFWDDIASETSGGTPGGSIYYQEESGKVIIQYQNLPHWSDTGSRYTFQIILYNDGRILFQYLKMSGFLTQSVIGIENSDGQNGMAISNKNQYVSDSLAVLISAPRFITDSSPTRGIVAPESSQQISISVSSKNLIADTYKNTLQIMTNDPSNPLVELPVFMHIKSNPLIVADVSQLAFKKSYIGFKDSLSVNIINRSADQYTLNLNTDSRAFRIKQGLSSMVLSPEEKREIVIYFVPSEAKEYQGNLSIFGVTKNSLLLKIPLTGDAVSPPVIHLNKESFSKEMTANSKIIESLRIDNFAGGNKLIWKISFSDPQLESPDDSITNPPSKLKEPLEFISLQAAPGNSIEHLASNPAKNIIYAMPEDYSRIMYSFDPYLNKWDSITSVPGNEMWDFNGVYLNDKMYIFEGGYSKTAVWVYDYINNLWLSYDDPIFNESYKQITTDGQFIYIANDNWASSVGEFRRYDPVNDTWENLPTPQFEYGNFYNALGLFHLNGYIYGTMINYDSPNTYYIERFNISSKKWEILYIVPEDIGYLANAAFDPVSESYLIFSSNGNVFLFNVNTNIWSKLEATNEFGNPSGISHLETRDISGFYIKGWKSFYKLNTYPKYHWIDTSPRLDSIKAAEASDISIIFDSEGLCPGKYKTIMTIASNDPKTPVIEVPVSLVIIDQSGTASQKASGINEGLTLTNQISVFPNPTHGEIRIITPEGTDFKYALMDALGNTIIPISDLHEPVLNLDKNVVHPGLYFLVIKNDRQQIIKKIIMK